jgi:hypothetical protein
VCQQNASSQITENNKKLHTERQKKQGETVEETSGYVRPEGVHKWRNSLMMTVMVVVMMN